LQRGLVIHQPHAYPVFRLAIARNFCVCSAD
jgi:hypothetical protein